MSKPSEEMINCFHEHSKTNIHGHGPLLDSIQAFPEFADFHIRNPSDKKTKGLRVVEKSWKTDEQKILGTIVEVNESGKDVKVQWDSRAKGDDTTCRKLSELRVFDNAGTGVLHNKVSCVECNTYPLRGLRWKCLDCDDYDLCTLCYMADVHNLRHIFKRINEKDSKGLEMQPRLPLQFTGHAYARGILPNAKVLHRRNVKKDEGTVLFSGGDNNIYVQWEKSGRSRHNILDLQVETAISLSFYPDHLPILQMGDTFDHYDEFSEEIATQKMQFKIRHLSKFEEESSHRPVLYLIFDNHQENYQTQEQFALMDEIFEYSRKTKLPCHVVGQKVLFLHGSSDTVCTHSETSKETIEELVRKGCLNFERGDKGKRTDEIDYFIEMATSVLGEKVIPVQIPLRNVIKDSENSLSIPTVQFERTSQDVRFFFAPKHSEEEEEYTTTLKSPWKATKSDTTTNKDNIELISSVKEVQSTLDFEALICYVTIGVFITNGCLEMDKELYAEALSMYLLKNGKWRIHVPTDAFSAFIKLFRYPCIKYIYEKDLRTAFANGLKADLETFTTPELVSNHFSEEEIQDTVAKSDVIGLIFLALLRNQFYTGAIQLIDTGFVCIRHILVGCKILHDISNDKKNEQIQRETSLRMKLYFTERANLITSFINEASPEIGEVEDDFGEAENHAGRLLLNHGYLEDAIKTENKTFLEDKTVTNILNKMWYGKEKSIIHQVGLCILLTLLHLIVMPLLMINIQARPFRWFYQKYNLPFMKALIQMLGYLALLMAYSYMLLFNLNEELSYTDYLIFGWMLSFCINETKQAIVSVLRHRFKRYISSWWNLLDWALMLAYTCGIGFKFGNNAIHEDAPTILLVITFILLSIRILNMFSISEYLGPKLVIIQKMFKDTFVFLIILTVIMMSYNVSYHSLLYPNSEFSWSEIEKVMQNGYWMLFGELNLEADTFTDCTFNKTIYTSGVLRRCPTSLGLHISPYLKALYELIAVILLLNLLIAIYSDTYQKVNDECKFHWSQLQTDFLEEYSVQTIFPIHLQLLVLPFLLGHSIIWCTKCCCKKMRWNKVNSGEEKRNENPMFIRVFLYNDNFDRRLESTDKAERSGAIRSKGKIDYTEEDKITKQMDDTNRKFKDHLKSNDEKLQKQMEDTNRKFVELLNRNVEMLKMIHEKMLKINNENMNKVEYKIQREFRDIQHVQGQTDSRKFHNKRCQTDKSSKKKKEKVIYPLTTTTFKLDGKNF